MTPKTPPLPPHAPRLRVPCLSSSEACLLADALQALLYSLWRAHGDDLADYYGSLGEPSPRPPHADPDAPF